MARTQFFSFINKAITESDAWKSGRSETHAISRRQMLKISLAGFLGSGLLSSAGLARSGERLEGEQRKARSAGGMPSIAIIGAGVAGLTAAYRLKKAGLKSTIFEADNRLGGRMLTHRDFFQGMYCELGGEFVDSNHQDLRLLANELGIELQPLNIGKGEELYFFGGDFHTPNEMLNAATQTGAFLPIAQQIASDQARLLDQSDNWTAHAVKLDQMSLRDYLGQFRGKTQDWAINLLDIAYLGEYGLETNEQSALNLIDLIGADMHQPFQVFGDSDEAFRIKGGSSELIDKLVLALEDTPIKRAHRLVELHVKEKQASVTFDTPKEKHDHTFDFVVFAIPFTCLRQVSGLETLGLSPVKLRCIHELGYGTNAKLMVGTKNRVWRSGELQFPASSNGSFYSDLPFQNIWEASRAQPGKAGILCNFLGGNAGEGSGDNALQTLQSGLAAISPKLAESVDDKKIASFFWARYPHVHGSYACPRPGQYTTLLDVAAEPALGGRIQFAGEHTSVEFLGYMNGGVESGNRAALALIKQMSAARNILHMAG